MVSGLSLSVTSACSVASVEAAADEFIQPLVQITAQLRQEFCEKSLAANAQYVQDVSQRLAKLLLLKHSLDKRHALLSAYCPPYRLKLSMEKCNIMLRFRSYLKAFADAAASETQLTADAVEAEQQQQQQQQQQQLEQQQQHVLSVSRAIGVVQRQRISEMRNEPWQAGS
jgi:hypothetical protein